MNKAEIQAFKRESERAYEKFIAEEKQRKEEIWKKHEEEIRVRINSKEYKEVLEWLKKRKAGEQR